MGLSHLTWSVDYYQSSVEIMQNMSTKHWDKDYYSVYGKLRVIIITIKKKKIKKGE